MFVYMEEKVCMSYLNSIYQKQFLELVRETVIEPNDTVGMYRRNYLRKVQQNKVL